jgi:hypothetical protein
MEFKCNCTNSGTNCFTGACNICGISKEKFKTIHENKALMNAFIEPQPTLIEILNNLENYVLSLPKIVYKSDGTGYGYISEGKDESGVYVKLEDVLSLFSAKK